MSLAYATLKLANLFNHKEALVEILVDIGATFMCVTEEIAFANRTYVTEAVLLGNEALLGVIPMEAMDVIVDPCNQGLTVNPLHSHYPVALA